MKDVPPFQKQQKGARKEKYALTLAKNLICFTTCNSIQYIYELQKSRKGWVAGMIPAMSREGVFNSFHTVGHYDPICTYQEVRPIEINE